MGSEEKRTYSEQVNATNEAIKAVTDMFDETLSYFNRWTAKGLPEGYYEESTKIYGGTKDAI